MAWTYVKGLINGPNWNRPIDWFTIPGIFKSKCTLSQRYLMSPFSPIIIINPYPANTESG